MFATYTTTLRDIMENPEGAVKLSEALSGYPLYEPQKLYDLIPDREQLNQRLLNHYKYREIGFDTVGRFLDELDITMREIMPYYNEMFKTVEIMAELPSPFDNVDVVEKYEETRTNENSVTTSENASGKNTTKQTENVENNSKNVHSETPGDYLNTLASNIDSVKYADDVTWNKDKNTSSVNSESESENESNLQSDGRTVGTTTHTYTKQGNQGVNTYAHDMNEFRTSIMDVVNEIINDVRINELFMMVF